MRLSRGLAFAAVTLAVVGCSKSTPATTPAPQPAPAARPAGTGNGAAPTATAARPAGQDTTQRAAGGPPGAAGEAQPRPYSRVITAEAKSRSGLFKTHQVGTRFYYEIPKSGLNKEMIVVTRGARVPAGSLAGAQIGQTQVVRWERRDNRVFLRQVSYEVVADSTNPIYTAVRSSAADVVLGAFNVEAYGPDSAAVIEVTRLYTAPPPEIGPGGLFRGQPDPARSYVERITPYPENIEVEATLTFPPAPAGVPTGGGGFGFGTAPTGTASITLHWSMVKLPEKPMMPRLADKRIGFFSLDQVDYGRPEQRAETRTYIVRYRLEKKDPNAAISDPVKPITYYVDPATPDWLKPWVKKGIEDWQPAFEAAGFRKGIVAADAPSKAQDPDWSPEDARYSVVRWTASTIENAFGPEVHDPRTGEILDADVQMFHNIMNLQRSWYFTQVGHLDPRAGMWPVPDSLMGRLVEYVVAHEVGHTLGYKHDMKGSSLYPVDSVRSRTWVAKMGHSPSIMDYSRFNYTAQPEDKIPLNDLIPRIGPWDIYTTHWGYAPIPTAKTSDEEWATLDKWSREQDQVPWYRFNVNDAGNADPGAQSEAVGDADPVKATGWGIQSIKQIVPLLVPATVYPGHDYEDLTMMYGRLVNQWATELRHVGIMVAGTWAQEKYGGQDGPRFVPWPKARQKEAVLFLNKNAFATPTWLMPEDILRKIEVEGAIRRINQAQAGVLATLVNDRRMERLVEFEAMAKNKADAYPLTEMLADIRAGIWGELKEGSVNIDAVRRELQRTYLAGMRAKLNPPAPPTGLPAQFAQLVGPARSTSDVKAAVRSELRALDADLAAALPKAGDRITRAHIEDARYQIKDMLDPKN